MKVTSKMVNLMAMGKVFKKIIMEKMKNQFMKVIGVKATIAVKEYFIYLVIIMWANFSMSLEKMGSISLEKFTTKMRHQANLSIRKASMRESKT